METEVVGRTETPPEHEPIVVPVAAYTVEGKEVVERFAFRPVMPAGAVIRAFRQIQPNGVLATAPILEFLEKSLMASDRERFLEFLDRDDLMIEASLIAQVYETVTEVWSSRPTRPRSASRSGGSPTKRTSRAGQRSQVSASKKSRS